MRNSQDFIRSLPDAGFRSRKPAKFWQKLHIDATLLVLLLTLIGAGSLVLYSASNESIDLVYRQLSRLGAGLLLMCVIAQIHPNTLRRWTPWCYLLGTGLLIAVLVMGINAKGAQRWLAIPGLPRFQPSEIMKLAVPMMISWFIAQRPVPPRFLSILCSLVLIGIVVTLVALQPDLGTSLLIGSAGIIVLFLAGLPFAYIASFIALSIPAAFVMWSFFMHDYQRQRVLTFINPQQDPLGAGWNIIQSTTAIGSGGLHGKGWLNGTQSHLDFLPESSTDFIIAVLAEEFGMIGVLCLLVLYLSILVRGFYISVNAQDTYSRLLSGAITYTFFVYIFVNIGMVSGLLPVVGVPLPLVSYGGTSVVTLLAGFGILMSISTHRKLLTH